MASTDITYRVNLDDSNLTSRLSAMRSNLNMMFGTAAGDFGGAMSGLAQYGGAATSAFGAMRGGLSQQMGVGTATDPAMAYSMHHGMLQAQSTLGQELMSVGMHPLSAGGPTAFAGVTPPGVGAADYTRMMQRNFAQRMTDTAMGAAGGAAGPVAGSLAGVAAGYLTKGMGMLAGGAIGVGAYMAADAIVGGGIERGNKIFGEVQDLGRIATAGRGMSLSDTHAFGRGFRSMSKNMGISTGETRDIIAGIRQSGMMPETRDVQQSLSQFESMARDIRDISVGMQTSLATATRYLKDVERLGMGRGSGGVFAASGMAGQLGTSLGGLISHVSQGQRVGMATGIGAGAGGQLALGSAFAGAAGLGSLTGGEQRMVGGALGLGRAFQMNALQNALGPWGQVQGMAMMGPTGAQGLPGSMMGTIGQAAGNIFGGGDPIANMVEFQTGRTRMLGQMGGKGIRLMQAQGIQAQANMLQELSPGLTQQRALQFTGMQQGLSEHQARGMAGFIMRGFRDPRPSSRAVGMPSVFSGGGGAAIRAAREGAIREDAQQLAESMKMPWTSAMEGIGNWWAEARQNMAEKAADWTRSRQVAMGIAPPTPESLAEAQQGFRSGTGMLASAGIDLAEMGTRGGAAMASVLAFGGAASTGGGGVGITMLDGQVITAASAQGATRGLATQLGRFARGQESKGLVREASIAIGTRMERGELTGERAKTLAENLRANLLKATGGAPDPEGMSAKWLAGNMGEVLKGTSLEKDFKKQGIGIFGSEKGAEAMSLVQGFINEQQGVRKTDVGRIIQQAAARGIGGAALAMEAKGADLVNDLLGAKKVDVEAEAREIIEKKTAEITKATQTSSLVNIPTPKPGERGVPTMAQAMATVRRRTRDQDVEGVTKADANRVLRSKSLREYVKTRDALYYKPWRDAKKKGSKGGEKLKDAARGKNTRKMELDKRQAVIDEAKATKNVGVIKAAKALLAGMEKEGSKHGKALADAVSMVPGAAPKKRRRRRRGGTVIAFQSQQESFQSQVATALKKTTHVLNKIAKSIPPPVRK